MLVKGASAEPWISRQLIPAWFHSTSLNCFRNRLRDVGAAHNLSLTCILTKFLDETYPSSHHISMYGILYIVHLWLNNLHVLVEKKPPKNKNKKQINQTKTKNPAGCNNPTCLYLEASNNLVYKPISVSSGYLCDWLMSISYYSYLLKECWGFKLL